MGRLRRQLPPAPVYTADANGGLCIERRCVDALGVLGPSATNKLRRVYTEALLATTVNVRQKRMNIVRISGIIYHINLVNGVYQAILENEKTGIGDMGK